METPRLLWQPDKNFSESSNLRQFIEWLAENEKAGFGDYQALWNWSVQDPAAFWAAIWKYFNIIHEGTPREIVRGEMPHAHWFRGCSLNYAEHVFRNASAGRPAIIFGDESGRTGSVSWDSLRDSVAKLQQFLRQNGITKGDRIAGYLPCIPEASVAMLATVSIGAIWSSASPDFGTNAVIDRFSQISPTVLIAVDEYSYNGKHFDKRDVISTLLSQLPTVKLAVIISRRPDGQWTANTHSWESIMLREPAEMTFLRVPFEHPIWILYSSGTTGLPKSITHSHGGILLEQLKYGAFHNDFKPGERCFWYTTTGWMMWNYIHGALLCGGTMVLYDGSPAYPDLNVLWKFASEQGITHFGTSAAFILSNMKAGIKPSAKFRFDKLRSIGSTGSTLPPEGFEWVYANVRKNLWLASMSGGTDVCSAFVGGNPMWPVYAGEIQCRALGCSLEAFDDAGKPVRHEVGEMVITRPMPSMPVFFWNDPEFKKYHESYFDVYPGVWRHGDWIEITPREGVIIYGRSDATLNRGGIRIGTSEIYRAVDKIREVKDSLIVCIEKEGGAFWMPLFVVLHEGFTADDTLKESINSVIRREYSPRHVPDEIIQVPDIPYTISGKKTETPVKKILMGKPPEKVINAGSLRNPAAMDFFVALARRRGIGTN